MNKPLALIITWLLSAFLMASEPELSTNVESTVTDLRANPGFLYAEERQQDTSLWLDYHVDLTISASALDNYAAHRSRHLCGGDYRWIAVEAYPYSPDGEKNAVKRQLDVVVECLKN